MNKTVAERFEEKFIPFNGCWLWIASRDKAGYGWFKFGGRAAKAHRVAWELAHGSIPDGLSVLHRCDTPACVNPAHLFLGTNDDNVADRVAKGRTKSIHAQKSHCPRGHEYTPENTRYGLQGKWTVRFCIECNLRSSRDGYLRNRKARIAKGVENTRALRARDAAAFRERARRYAAVARERRRAAKH